MSKPLNREKQAVLLLLLIIAVVVVTLRFSCSKAPEADVNPVTPTVTVKADSVSDTAGARARKSKRRGAPKKADPKTLKETEDKEFHHDSPLHKPVKSN